MRLMLDIDYEDEAYLDTLSGVELRMAYRDAPDEKKHFIAKYASSRLIDLEYEAEKTSCYKVLAEVNIVTEYNDNVASDDSKVDINYEKIYNYALAALRATRNDEMFNGEELAVAIRTKSLTEMLLFSVEKLDASFKDREEYKNTQNIKSASKASIEEGLSNPEESHTDLAASEYNNAEELGALDDVDSEAKNTFFRYIMELNGFSLIGDENEDHVDEEPVDIEKEVREADQKLFNNIESDKIYYEEDGKVYPNPLYEECFALAEKIQYEFPAEVDDKDKPKYKDLYNQQLMINALQRATHDVLRNPELIKNAKDKDEIVKIFKGLIGDNFIRGVTIAGLATHEKTANSLWVNNTGRVRYNDDIDVSSIIDEIKEGKSPINPLAVAMDTYQLGNETSYIERDLKYKKIDRKKLSFFQKVEAIGKALYNNIVKQGGWKKIALNVAVLGPAAVVMGTASIPAAIAAGCVYVGWSAANNFYGPVLDKLTREARGKKITKIKHKWGYIKAHWKRAKEQKFAEPKYIKRAIWRTAKSFAIATATIGVGGLASALKVHEVSEWVPILSRQTIITGLEAIGTLISKTERDIAKETMNESYTLKNYHELQTFESYFAQDKVSLCTVAGMSAFFDIMKVTGATDHLSDKVSELVGKIKENNSSLKIEILEDVEGQPKTLASEYVQDPDSTVNAGQQDPDSIVNTGQQDPDSTVIAGQQDPDSTVIAGQEGLDEIVQGEGSFNNSEVVIDKNSLDGPLKRMFINSEKKWDRHGLNEYIGRFEEAGYKVTGNYSGSDHSNIQEFYRAIVNGKVESCPDGMSPVEYVDRLTRLSQLAPVTQKKAIELMVRDLMCQDFVPSDAEKQTISEALNTIIYTKGTSKCIIFDANGNKCIETMGNFGNYIGKQQEAEIQLETGEVVKLPIRTANVTKALGAEIDCGMGVGKITSIYTVGHIDCGCNDPVIPPLNDTPIIDHSAGGEHIGVSAEKDVILAKENINVNMQDPVAKAAYIKSSKSTYPEVDPGTLHGEAKAFIESKGTLHIWEKSPLTVTQEGFENTRVESLNGTQVNFQVPRNITQTIEKLPNVPTEVVANSEDGSLTYVYKFEKGLDISVVMDAPKDGETERVGHFFIGNKEVILDKNSANALMAKMSENTGMEFTSTDASEQNVMENIKINDRLQNKIDRYNSKLANGIENPIAPVDGATHIIPRVSSEAVTLSAEQKTQIMANNTELNYVGTQDGKAILTVDGVEGITRIRVQAPTHVDYDISKYQPTATVGENGQYSVSITTADEKEVIVNIAGGKARVTVDGENAVLDTNSTRTTENLVVKALRDKGVNMKVKLHTEFTEKVVSTIEAGRSESQITALNSASSRSGSMTVSQVAGGMRSGVRRA